MKKIALIVFLVVGAGNANSQSKISHEIFDVLLKKYVSADGKVNYKGFVKDTVTLNRYLSLISNIGCLFLFKYLIFFYNSGRILFCLGTPININSIT